ncbi:MAG: DNA recombination protein RmuC, partial [Gammaproteobacteria bacterium]|nr:DNA recombination protein RmuC [Gammaproteobacteria bacterium]
HASIVAERVRELAAKAYWSQFERSPEFVILFIPGDQFLSAALTQRPALLDEALRQNIILATPTSFVALLKAVAYGWQQVQLAENAAEIRQLGTQLYERLNSFAGHLTQVGKSLGDSVKAYNRGIGSLERMVLPGARRFTELGVRPRQKIPPLPPIEELPRDLSIDDTDAAAAGTSDHSEPLDDGLPAAEDAPSAEGAVSPGTAAPESADDGGEDAASSPADAAGAESPDAYGTGEAAGPADDDDASRADRLAITTDRE